MFKLRVELIEIWWN